ncbi:MAG: hypothetical protein ACRDGJ_01015, partial [Candidatus Limnocylindria bacterium]
MEASEGAATGRPRRWLSALAWGLGLLGVGEAVGILALLSSIPPDAGTLPSERYLILVFLATISAYSLVGAAIAARRPDHYAGWTLAAGGVGFGLAVLGFAYGQAGLRSASHLPGAEFGPWLGDVLFVPTLVGTGILFLLHFPSGRLPGSRWIWVQRATIAAGALYMVGQAFRPGFIYDDYRTLANPLGAPAEIEWLLEGMTAAGNVASAVLALTVPVALVQRYGSSNTVERLQLKWISYVGSGIAIALPIAALQVDVLSDIAWAIGITLVAALPVAVAFAVLRYRLYDIDRLISRTIVYGGLTAILAGLYTASIRLLNGVFVAVTGEESDAALVITTLILATTLTPIRRWLEGLVEGRYQE